MTAYEPVSGILTLFDILLASFVLRNYEKIHRISIMLYSLKSIEVHTFSAHFIISEQLLSDSGVVYEYT